jgi:hypothetical protein
MCLSGIQIENFTKVDLPDVPQQTNQ